MSRFANWKTTLFIFITLLFALPFFANAESIKVIPGVVVVAFEELPDFNVFTDKDGDLSSDNSEIDALLHEYEARSFKSEFGRHMAEYYVLRYSKNFSTEEVINSFSLLDNVKYVEPDYAFPLDVLRRVPNDNLLSNQWHINAINATEAWAVSTGNPDIEIGIIDTGIDYDHPDLAPVIWVNSAEDLNGNGTLDPDDINEIDDDGNGYVDDVVGYDWVDNDPGDLFPGEDGFPQDNDPSDFDGHGTHCAGDAAATTDNGLGVAGPGWGCRVVALRSGYTSTDGRGYVNMTAATSAINYAVDMGFDVLSMSFGGDGGNPTTFDVAMSIATQQNIVICAAAGNSGSTTPHYPAANNEVIGVAASREDGHLANFSNRGTWVSITAPGQGIFSTINGGSYGNMSGTSMSTPVLAGVVAQIKSLRPNWDKELVESWLNYTATPMAEEGTGGGLVNFAKAIDMFVSIDSIYTINSNGGPALLFDDQGTLGLRWHKRTDSGINTDVSMRLIVENDRITAGEDSLYLGTVLEGFDGVWEIPVTITENGLEFESFEIVVEFAGSDNYFEAFDYRQELKFSVGQAQVLVMSHDEGGSTGILPYFTTPLEELGYSNAIAHRANVSTMSSMLEGYSVLISATGTARENIFTNDDLVAISGFLHNGGKWLLTGQNVGEYMFWNHNTALDTMLHIGYVSDNANRMVVQGIEGNELTEGMAFILSGDGGASNQVDPDIISANEETDQLFIYNTNMPDELAGARYHGDNVDLVVFSFGFEAINDSIVAATPRAVLMQMLFDAWGFGSDVENETTVSPVQYALGSPWPNPTNGALVVPVTLAQKGVVNLAVYDLLGRQVAKYNYNALAGQNRIAWTLPSDIASGTYILRASNPNFNSFKKVVFLK